MNKKTMTKNRIFLLMLLYQRSIYKAPINNILFNYNKLKKLKKFNYNKCVNLFTKLINNIELIDESIYKISKRNINDFSLVEINILRIAIFEFKFINTPRKVIISEALKLSIKYGNFNSFKLINWILDNYKNF